MDYGHFHKPSYIAVIFLTLLSLLATIAFSFIASGTFGDTDLFLNTTGGVSEYFYTEITPAGWTFIIWAIIYIWQLLWLLYGVSTIIRRTTYGFLYIVPPTSPPSLYCIYIVNLGLNIGWIFLWDRFYPSLALVAIILCDVALYVCLTISFRQMYIYTKVLIAEDMIKDIWLIRVLIQNGLGFYAAWTTIATLLNLDVVMTYRGGLSQSVSSTICLGALFCLIVTWWFLDMYKLDNYVRYCYAPYVVFPVALAGSIAWNWDIAANNSVLTALILAVCCLLAVVKLTVMVYRAFRKPIFKDQLLLHYKDGHDGGTIYGTADYENVVLS